MIIIIFAELQLLNNNNNNNYSQMWSLFLL